MEKANNPMGIQKIEENEKNIQVFCKVKAKSERDIKVEETYYKDNQSLVEIVDHQTIRFENVKTDFQTKKVQ